MQFQGRIRPEECGKTNDEGAQIIQAEGKTKPEQRKKRATVEKAKAKQDEKKAKQEHEEAN